MNHALGFFAFGIIMMSAAAGVGVFLAARVLWDFPLILNLPGASFCFGMAFSLMAWLTGGLFGPQSPEFHWYHWMIYLGLAMGWYGVMSHLLAWWRSN